jgi:hypothetical protein
MIGGMGALAPERRGEIVALGMKSILAGTLATLMTAFKSEDQTVYLMSFLALCQDVLGKLVQRGDHRVSNGH